MGRERRRARSERTQESGRQWPRPWGPRAGSSSSSVAPRRRVKTEGQVLEMVVAEVPCDLSLSFWFQSLGRQAGRRGPRVCRELGHACAKLDVSVSSHSSKPWRYLVASWPVLGPCYGKRPADPSGQLHRTNKHTEGLDCDSFSQTKCSNTLVLRGGGEGRPGRLETGTSKRERL